MAMTANLFEPNAENSAAEDQSINEVVNVGICHELFTYKHFGIKALYLLICKAFYNTSPYRLLLHLNKHVN